MLFFFLFLAWRILFVVNSILKIKNVCWSLNLAPRLCGICRIQRRFYFFFLDRKHPSWVNLVQKFKVFSLFWIWYLDYFYVKFDSDGHFSVLDFFASFFFKKFIWHFSRVFVIYHAKNIIVRYSFNFWFKKLFLTKLLSRISRQTWTSSFTWNIDLKEEKSCNKIVSESFKTLFHLAVMSNNILRSNISSVFQPYWTFQGKKKIREQYRKSDK